MIKKRFGPVTTLATEAREPVQIRWESLAEVSLEDAEAFLEHMNDAVRYAQDVERGGRDPKQHATGQRGGNTTE